MEHWRKGFITASGGHLNPKNCTECNNEANLYPAGVQEKKEVNKTEHEKLREQVEGQGGLLPNMEPFERKYADDSENKLIPNR